MKQHINGFTLIELLAVIVILAVIAIIATPITLNIINAAEKNTFKDSVYGALKASKIALANQTFEENPENELTFNFSTGDNIDKLDLGGQVPKEGYIKIDEDGNTEVLINDGKYCAKKSSDDDDITIEKYEESLCQSKTYKYYKNGTIVYYNPVTNKICNDYTEDNSNTGVKDGCLKWYTFNDNIENANVNMILDHNTTASVEWVSDEDYGSSANNDKGPITANKQLESDTENWNKNLNSRLISADEVATIVENKSWIPSIGGTLFFHNTNTADSLSTGSGNVCASSGCEYGWLYDRTFINCTSAGCFNNAQDATTTAYWTSSKSNLIKSSYKVFWSGYVTSSSINEGKNGIRPVITVLKTNLS